MHCLSCVSYHAARLYVDCGHPEYCTPECSDRWERTKYHHTGDIILYDLAVRLKKQKDLAVSLRRDNSDGFDTSFGFHENYLLKRSVSIRELQSALVPFLVSSPVLLAQDAWMQR